MVASTSSTPARARAPETSLAVEDSTSSTSTRHEAGREETYAESAAPKYGGLNDLDGMPDLYPNLDDCFEEEDFDGAGKSEP